METAFNQSASKAAAGAIEHLKYKKSTRSKKKRTRKPVPKWYNKCWDFLFFMLK